MPRELYTLSPLDESIFEKSTSLEYGPDGSILKCASFLTSFYIRTPDQESGWEFDFQISPGWQLKTHHALQTDITIIGGFGSGKTLFRGMSALVDATTLPDYKFLNVAPTGWQSKQMYDILLTWLDGTLFAEKFLWKFVEKPFPKITIMYKTPNRKNEKGQIIPGRVVKSTLEFMSMSDDAQRIKTWEGDAINIDQGEQIENLSESIISLGTRLRGTIRGRERQGRLSITANSEDNPELWYIFDLAEAYPETNLSVQVSTHSNHNLTKKQVDGFIRRIKDPSKLAQHLGGDRPTGGGIEFTAQMLEEATDDELDRILKTGIEAHVELFEQREERESGVVLWKIPPIQGRDYVVLGDPGHGRPPYRNAPVVLVMDITDYPDGPCTLSGFWWGDSGGRIEPFLTQFLTWRKEFKTVNGAYDGTAGQKVHSEISFKGMDDIISIDMSGSGVKKKSFINTLKLKMLQGKIKVPRGITGLRWQFLKYKLPDEKIAQDIVATFLVFAGYLWWLGIEEPNDGEDDKGLGARTMNLHNRYSRQNIGRRDTPNRPRRR